MKNTFKGFGPIYIINLKKREDRKKSLISQFKKHNISNYTFCEAVDGINDNIEDYLVSTDIKISNQEAACTISHLLTIKHWLETDKSDYAIIMEDDISFETVDFWQFTWNDFLSKIKHKYDMLQLCIINSRKINTSFHLRELNDFSATCYLITRKRAITLLTKHFVDGKIVLPQSNLYAVADTLVYSGATCYTFPMFTYSLDFDSDISDGRNTDTKNLHIKSKEETINFWKTKPKQIYKSIGGRVLNG